MKSAGFFSWRAIIQKYPAIVAFQEKKMIFFGVPVRAVGAFLEFAQGVAYADNRPFSHFGKKMLVFGVPVRAVGAFSPVRSRPVESRPTHHAHHHAQLGRREHAAAR